MANFLAVWDPEADRRESFLDRVTSDLVIVPDLRRDRVEAGPVSIAWASARDAPLSTARRERPRPEAAVVWGDALREDGRRIEAAELLDLRRPGVESPAPCFDGFHAWARASADHGIAVGADPLGLFPVYWGQPRSDVLLVASTVGIIGRHPEVSGELDPRGLAGLLVTNGLLEGRTLLRGVRRLAPGRVLDWAPDRPATERNAYRPEPGPRSGGRTWPDLAGEADAVLEDAVRRHLAGRPSATFLSGGLDSRMLTGYACGVAEVGPAVTLGAPSDLEVRCAARVAEALGLNRIRVDQRPAEIASGAKIEAGPKLLSDGMSGAHGWTLALRGVELPPAMLTGYLGNAVLAASHVDWAQAPEDGTLSGTTFATALNRWGVPVRTLRRISRPWFREQGLEPTLDHLEDRLLPPASSLDHRLWISYLQHRQRFHVGSQMWRLSFASWPVAPVVDRAVLDTMGSLPMAAFRGRRLQLHLLRNRFPALARLPQDRNSWNTLPPEPTTTDHVFHALERRLRQSRAGRWWMRRRGERRYFYRVYDLDSPGWRKVRRAAEPGRSSLDDLFDMELVTEDYLPPPDRDVDLDDAIIDAAGRKLLLGLMLASHRVAGSASVQKGDDAPGA